MGAVRRGRRGHLTRRVEKLKPNGASIDFHSRRTSPRFGIEDCFGRVAQIGYGLTTALRTRRFPRETPFLVTPSGVFSHPPTVWATRPFHFSSQAGTPA